MTIFVDFGTLAILAFFAVAAVLGSAMNFMQWVIANIPLVIGLLLIKAVIWALLSETFKEHFGWGILCTVLDMLRTGIFLWFLVSHLSSAFSGDPSHMVVSLFSLILVLPFYFGAYCIADKYLGDANLIVGEILSLGATGLVYLLIWLLSVIL